MRQSRLFQVLALFGSALTLIVTILIFRHNTPLKFPSLFNSELIVQNTYLGPTSPVSGNPQLIRVEVSIYDEPKEGGLEVQFAELNGISIPLKPRDVYGFRGKGSFQLPPGKYKLEWIVNRDKFAWPRSISHEQNVDLDKRDLWVQIIVKGDTAAIQ